MTPTFPSQPASSPHLRPVPSKVLPLVSPRALSRGLIGVMVVLLILVSFPVTKPLSAQTLETPGTDGGHGVDLDQLEAGSLVFQSGDGYLPAPIVDTKVDLKITAMIGRAQVVQRFFNPSDEWLEGLYVFPLPENAAVDTLRMVIGNRVIEGQVREKDEARATYVQARNEGRQASLVEQHRPNLFTAAVANVGPGETIEVHLEYQHEVSYVDGMFSLRFPTVVAPRFSPTPSSPDETIDLPSGIVLASRPLRADPADLASTSDGGPTVEILVDLAPGVLLDRIDSPSHSIVTQPYGGGRVPGYTVMLTSDRSDGRVAADRDFVLQWRPLQGEEPQAAVFSEEIDGQTYVLLMLVPPVPANEGAASAVRLSREMVFVIDTSGSMSGRALDEAKEALQVGLDRLAPGDLFNVIEFNSITRRLFPASVVADRANLQIAEDFVDDLEADGGTEMMAALQAALGDPGEWNSIDESGFDVPNRLRGNGWLRQVVFLTDGAVSNEDDLLVAIDEGLGNSRLFTVGIGSAPNSWFMRKAAQRGRGTYTFIASTDEVAEATGALLNRLETPTVRDVEVLWDDPSVEMWPQRVPDLYAGEPVVVTARLSDPGLGALVVGKRGRGGVTEAWEEALPLAAGDIGSGIDRLWARRQIGSLMDSLREGADPDEVRSAVVALSLDHRLVSRYTSLVAVDVTPVAPADADSSGRAGMVPLRSPAGSDGAQMLGMLPQGGTSARLLFVLGLLALIGGMLLAWHRSPSPE